ncbi:EAL domain-containing response regulator [Pengzhenrongella sicca]|uniref:EAL domain-containing response regulator n=1 Tax=Pengzhenrongella sicca TaxID=2819238 RepID=A0A8A4ZE25_9MICO|nr:EAL domain-containing response regulator [Pengzhenrongella sicca]QTE30222.1 EAL domain-containing response regulator [Pengzhenrongella sicca]
MPRLLERFSTMSVLIVDDNEANVALVRALLMNEGIHRITAETDSRRVAGRLAAIDPDLVLLDLYMPHLDGHAVLEQIVRFAAGSYLPVLVLTADSTRQSRDLALSKGARDFLTKPLDTVEFGLRVANLLETRQLHTAIRRAVGGGPAVPQATEGELARMRDRVETVIQDGSITPVFQRVAELGTRATVGHEALARFARPHEHGPAGWFRDAFTVGHGIELELDAVTRALPFLDDDAGTFLAVNMAPATVLQLRRGDLEDRPVDRIVIELTEHAPVEDYAAVRRALASMRADGLRLAVDDVGSGYAGFQHILALEPDIIKLDISLINGIERSRMQRALASALVAFATDIAAVVIAEGVETAAELEVLGDIGVPWGQGYFLGRPEPARAVRA